MKQHLAAVALVSLVLAGCDSQTSAELKTPAQKASYGIGLNMGKSLAQEGMDDLDSQAVAQGIEDAIGKKEQKLKDDELVEAFAFLQKRAEERMAALNDEAAKAGKKFLEDNAKRDGVKTTASGLQYEIVTKAEGAQPKATDVVSVHYEGRLTDGKVFDSSIQRGSPIDLPVSGVIPGWVEALQLMHVGEKAKLYIPSELAYGAQSPSPAANSHFAIRYFRSQAQAAPLAAITKRCRGSPNTTLRDRATTRAVNSAAISSCTMIRLPELQHSPALK